MKLKTTVVAEKKFLNEYFASDFNKEAAGHKGTGTITNGHKIYKMEISASKVKAKLEEL